MKFQEVLFDKLKKLKILVIDSNPIVYIGLKSIFKNSLIIGVVGYSDTQKNINDQLNLLDIDLIISDIYYKDGNVNYL